MSSWYWPSCGSAQCWGLFSMSGMMMAQQRDDVHATMAMMPMENGVALFSIEFCIYFI
jgi:hypothetical protein